MISEAAQEVIEALKYGNVFLTGAAGTGKSYVTSEVIAYYRESGKQVVALGSTGVSAVNIGGFTLHSFFAFGIASDFEALAAQEKYNKRRLRDLRKILAATDLIVIDEISMVGSALLEMVRFRLQSLGYSGRLLFVGDFFQLPPVQRSEAGLLGERLYAFESEAWEAFAPHTIVLRTMHRTKDRYFTEILERIRHGSCDAEVRGYLSMLHEKEPEGDNPTMLYGRNAEVAHYNRMQLNLLQSEETILFADIKTHETVDERKLQRWVQTLPVDAQLTLKVGAPVLFTMNKWGSFVNGERGILRKIEEAHLIVEKEEAFVRVERHDFDLTELGVDDAGEPKERVLATLSQFPVKLAYAITIHKSQGMSIDKLVCNVDHIFAPSQFYVALSRATDPKHLRIDYHGGNFDAYLHRIIRTDSRVEAFMSQV